jgi:hypothetical protein
LVFLFYYFILFFLCEGGEAVDSYNKVEFLEFMKKRGVFIIIIVIIIVGSSFFKENNEKSNGGVIDKNDLNSFLPLHYYPAFALLCPLSRSNHPFPFEFDEKMVEYKQFVNSFNKKVLLFFFII